MDKTVTAYTTYIFSKEDILSALQGVFPELKGCTVDRMHFKNYEIRPLSIRSVSGADG